MPTFQEIYSRYNNARENKLISPDESIADYAKRALAFTGDPSYRSVAEGGTIGNFVRSRSADLTNFVNSGPVDEWLGQGTQWIGDKFGVDPEVSRGVGESLPRMAVDFLPMAAGAALAPYTGGASLSIAGAGLAGTSALSAANAYEQSGKVSDAIIGGVSPYVGSKLSEIGGRAALNLVPKSNILKSLGFTGGTLVENAALDTAERAALMARQGVTQEVANAATKSFTRLDKPLDKVLHYAGGEALANVGFTGLDIVQQGKDAVFNRDYLFANLVSNVPFAAADLAGSFASRQLGETKFNLPEAAPVYRSPGEERAIYAAAMFEDFKDPKAAIEYRRKYGLDISDTIIRTHELAAALDAKESGMRVNEADFVAKWNSYVESDPLALQAGLKPIRRGGAFGQELIGLQEAIKGKKPMPRAEELVKEFKDKNQRLRAKVGQVVSNLGKPVNTVDSLKLGVMKLGLDEFLQTPVEQRDYAKALDGTFLSLDGVDLIRDIHRKDAGLEPLRPDLYQEFVNLAIGKPRTFTPDKHLELLVAASLARGETPKMVKAKKRGTTAQEEGQKADVVIEETLKGFQEENKTVLEKFRQPVIPDDLQSGLLDLGQPTGDVTQGLGQRQRVQPAEFQSGLGDLGTTQGDLLSQVPRVEPTPESAPTTQLDQLIQNMPAKWPQDVKDIVAEFYRTRDSKVLYKIEGQNSLLRKQFAEKALREAYPEYDKETLEWEKKEAAKTKTINTLQDRSLDADDLELDVLDSSQADIELLPEESFLRAEDWSKVKDQTGRVNLVPRPEGEFQAVQAFAKSLMSKLVPKEEVDARWGEMVQLAKMFNNPEVAYAELAGMGKIDDAQLAQSFRPAVKLGELVYEAPTHLQAWERHFGKPFSQFGPNETAQMKDTVLKEGFVTEKGFSNRVDAAKDFLAKGGKLNLTPGEERDWLDSSDFQYARSPDPLGTNLREIVTGYEKVEDNLLGFTKDQGKQKSYEEQNYSYKLPIEISTDGGKTWYEDVVKGLNYGHAVEKAKRAWDSDVALRLISKEDSRLSDVDFAQTQGKIYGAASYQARKIFMNSKAFQGKSATERLRFVFAHENSHISFAKAINGEYGPNAKALADSAQQWVNQADPQAKKNVEDVIRELHLDPELANMDGIRDVLNNPDPQEWLANVWAMYAMGALKPKSTKESYAFLPKSIRDFVDWAVSGLQSLAKGAQTWLRLSGGNYKAAKDMKDLFNEVRRSFRQAEWDAAQAREFLDLDAASRIEKMNDLAFAQSGEDKLGQVGEQPFKDAPARWFGNAWNKTIQPIHTLASAHKEFVEPVMAVMQSPSETSEVIADVFKVVVGEYDGKDKVRINNQAFARVKGSEALNKLANAIITRSQVVKQRMLKLKDSSLAAGELKEELDFDALSPELRGKFQQFTPEAQQALVTYIAQSERANILLQKKIMEAEGQKMTNNLATLLITKGSFNKADFGKAPEIAKGLVADLQMGDVINAQSKLVGLDESDQAKMMQQAQELVASHVKLQKYYDEHPTYMSFRRFGKITQRIKKAGQPDDVIDADTELELKELLKYYKEQGWEEYGDRKTREVKKGQSYALDSELLTIMQQREKMFKEMIDNSQSLTPAEKTEILNQPTASEAMISEINSRELYKPTTGRKLVGDLERFDWFDQFQKYVPAAISAAQRSALGAKVNFWMQRPEIVNMKLQKDQFMNLYEQSKSPDPEWARKLNKANAVWHIGWNLPGHIAEVFQPMVSMLPELIAKGSSLPEAFKLTAQAEKDVIKTHGYRLKDKFFNRDKATHKVGDEEFEGLAAIWLKTHGESPQTIDEARMLHEKRGRIQKAPLSELRDFDGTDQERMQDFLDGKKPGRLAELIRRPFHTYAEAAMGFYSNFTQHNGAVALVTAYRKFRKEGLSHAEASQKAELFDLTVNNSGGRLERPEMFGKMGGAGHFVYGLSSFVRGRFAQLATYYRHGFDQTQFKNKLEPGEVAAAKKAFQTMILAQVGAAGLLGLPFIGAGIALMEELTGEDIKGKMIGALDEVTNDPMLTRLMTHGMMSTMAEGLGIPADLHSRFALSSFLGTNSYDGMSAKSLMGPSVAMFDSMFKLGSQVAQGEDFGKALAVGGPGGVKRLAEALSEDFQRDNPEADLLTSMMGFRSPQMVKQKEWEQITRKQEFEASRDLEKSAMEIYKAMEESPRSARQRLLIEADKLLPEGLDRASVIQQRQQNIKDLVQKVSRLAADKVGPEDPRRGLSGRVAPVASQTAQAMGVQMPNPMELARALAQQKTRSQLGQTTSQRPIRNAQIQELQWDKNPWNFKSY